MHLAVEILSADTSDWQLWRGWPADSLMVLAVLVAAFCVLYDRVWRKTRNLVTIAHEGGHALMALLTGRRLTAIRLHSDTSGLTVSSGKPYGPGMIATGAAGYLAPPVVGLFVAVLVRAELATVVLWLGAIAMLAMLVMTRNAYGVFTIVISVVLTLGVSFLAPVGFHAIIVAAVAWFLLLAGPRTLVELHRHRKYSTGSDVDQLAKLTHFPAALWMVIFGAGMFVTLIVGGAALATTTLNSSAI